jgi:hypothetical protein
VDKVAGGSYFVVSFSSGHTTLPVKFAVTLPRGMVIVSSVSVLVIVKSPWPEALLEPAGAPENFEGSHTAVTRFAGACPAPTDVRATLRQKETAAFASDRGIGSDGGFRRMPWRRVILFVPYVVEAQAMFPSTPNRQCPICHMAMQSPLRTCLGKVLN